MKKIICGTLISLIFISKISFKILGIIPKTFSLLIFQYGIHPVINLTVQFVLGFFLLMLWIKTQNKIDVFPKYYLGMISIFIFILITQTSLQMLDGSSSLPPLFFLIGLIMAIFLIVFYGVVIPSMIPAGLFINTTLIINRPIIFLSLIASPFFWIFMQKGGRFIGLYKHIPHLVTASSICFMFELFLFFNNFDFSIKYKKLTSIFFILVFIIASFLTFTKATYMSLVFYILLAPFFLGPKTIKFSLFKTFVVLTTISIMLLLGNVIWEKIIDYSSGKSSIGLRNAQNGIESRTEEIYRGLDILKKSPMLGLGIMYKYANPKSNDVEVDSYNSFKDPHNFFVSAGVIGGIPLMLFSFIAYLSMIIASVLALLSTHIEKRLFGLIILCHLPVFLIYHLHLSMGGVADRMYWLLLGFMAKNTKLKKT